MNSFPMLFESEGKRASTGSARTDVAGRGYGTGLTLINVQMPIKTQLTAKPSRKRRMSGRSNGASLALGMMAQAL